MLLRTLRQLTADELSQAAIRCGARRGAGPEEIFRSLAHACGAYTWSLFPATTDEALLDHVGRRLGMEPLAPGQTALQVRERAIFAAYFRRAWEAASPEQRQAVLAGALVAWDNATLPYPELSDVPVEAPVHPTLEALLQNSTGCRALAAVAERLPLPLPETGASRGPLSFAISGVRLTPGHAALYEVLLIVWRARGRLLRERRVQRTQVERQLRQLDSLITVRRKNLSSGPSHWTRNPASGVSVAAAGLVSTVAHLTLTAGANVLVVPAMAVGVAGVAWAASAVYLAPRPRRDDRVARMQTQLTTLRGQLTQVDRDLRALETE